jgi:hypothetical protein
MHYQYGEAFERSGIPGMGRQGAPWCAHDPQGTLVLMAHQNYVQRRETGWQYEMPDRGQLPVRGPSANRSWDIISTYFALDKPIVLLIAVFTVDGRIREDGTWEQSEFKHAIGDAYRARMKACNPAHGYLLCQIESKFSY